MTIAPINSTRLTEAEEDFRRSREDVLGLKYEGEMIPVLEFLRFKCEDDITAATFEEELHSIHDFIDSLPLTMLHSNKLSVLARTVQVLRFCLKHIKVNKTIKGLANFSDKDFEAIGLTEGEPIELNWTAIESKTQQLSTCYASTQGRYKRYCRAGSKESSFQGYAETSIMEVLSQLSDDQHLRGHIILHHQLTIRGANFNNADITARGFPDFVVFSSLNKEDKGEDSDEEGDAVDNGPSTNRLVSSMSTVPTESAEQGASVSDVEDRPRGESEHDDASSAGDRSTGEISTDGILLQREHQWKACTIELKPPHLAFDDEHVREAVIQAAALDRRGEVSKETQRFLLTSGRRYKFGILHANKYHLSRQLRIQVRPAEIITLMKEWFTAPGDKHSEAGLWTCKDLDNNDQ